MFRSRLFSLRPVCRPGAAIGVPARSVARYQTKVIHRDLPPAPTKSRRPWYIGGALVGTAVWVVGLSAALNYQRLSSSVVSGTLFMVRYDPRVIELVGDHVDYADSWPWISGTVNHLKGKVDIAFEIVGDKGERAKVHFSSQRRGYVWHTLEFTVTRLADQEVIDIGHHELTDQGAPFALEHLE
ncbi:cytochrome oxidase complex assembly protein 1-domain-containing protein [Gongronella butleri]|nr:cytochrome oxidase complex assembly protein 1-domain-containing protein [Gongronella butleri]